MPENIDKISFSNPKFTGQYEYIDAYIYEEKNKSIIIENKINWATDQKEQIQRYIESSKKHNIPPEKIYVIYLTDDGRKEISDFSLTKDAKDDLNMTEDYNGRFIKLNYREHILPLLRDILSYLDFSKEIYLKSAIVQYIDYLEGRFALRTREKAYMDHMIQGLSSILQIKTEDVKTISEKRRLYDSIRKFQTQLKTDINEYKIIEPYFEALCKSLYPDEIQPSYVIKKLIFHFADKDGNIKEDFKDSILFEKLKIRWDLIRQNNNKVSFVIDNIQDAFVIEFTTEIIKFTVNYQKSQFLENLSKYQEIIKLKTTKEENEFEIDYESNYQTIISQVLMLLKAMKETLR